MRLLRCSVLLGRLRPYRQAPEAEAAQQSANRSLGQRDAELLGDLSPEIGSSPADDAMLGQTRPFPNPLSNLLLLFGRKAARRARRCPVVKPLQSLDVIAMDPVPQRLSLHAAQPRRLAPRLAIQNMRQRQHPTRCIGVPRPRRRTT